MLSRLRNLKSSRLSKVAFHNFQPTTSSGILLLIIFFSLRGILLAQGTSTVTGQIIDPTGAAVANAVITLRDDSQHSQTSKSDKTGRFNLKQLPAGNYKLQVNAEGFTTYEESLNLPSTALKISLRLAEIKSEVDVKSQSRRLSVESAQNANSKVLRGDEIRRLPHNEAQLRRVLQAMSGAFATNLNFTVNGMSNAKLPPLETIKEIRINNDPFSAAYHEPGSARIEIETKGQDEQIQAGGHLNYRHSALDARNAFSAEKPPLEHRDYGGWWSSKLFSKRTFIYGYFERNQHDETSLVNAYNLDGAFYDTPPLLHRGLRMNLRADYVPSEMHTISFFYDLERGKEQGLGISTFDLPERGYDSNALDHNFHFNARSILSPRAINEISLRAGRERIKSTTDNFDQSIEVAGAFTSGGAQCCPEQRINHQFALLDNFSLSAGRHFLKTGISVSGARINDVSERDFGGSFLFSGLSFYRLNRPILYTINLGDPLLKFGLWDFSGYAQDDIKLKSNLTISPGIRYEAQTQLSDHNNFAPRLGLAWSPFKSDSMVLRAGAGIFYQQITDGQLGEALRFDGVRQRQVVISRPRFPNPLGNRAITDFPITINKLAPNLRTPYQFHSSIGIEQQLPRDTTLTLNYNFVRGVHLFRTRDINAPLVTGLRPLTNFLQIKQLESSNFSTSHNLAIGLSHTLNERLSIFATYKLSRTIDEADSAETLPINNYFVRQERGFAAQDMRHQFFANAMMTLPLGVELSPMFSFNTGLPYNITTGLDDNNDAIINDRPLGIARNSGRGSNFASFDLRLSRQFTAGKRSAGGDNARPLSIEFAFEFTNLLNRTNLTDFNGIQTSPFFKQAVAAHDPRQLSVFLNFSFH